MPNVVEIIVYRLLHKHTYEKNVYCTEIFIRFYHVLISRQKLDLYRIFTRMTIFINRYSL